MSDDAAGDAWDADLYDDSHGFVHEYGADLLDLLAAEPGERVLDLGCGTGHLTDAIAGTGATAVGLDRSREMVGRARTAYPSIPFVVADARRPPFAAAFDAVLSNAALHWVPELDQEAALTAVREALRPGGRFVAELGGTGNVEAVVGALRRALGECGHEADSPWYFPSVGEYASLLESVGLRVRYARLFDRATELDDGRAGLRNWLSMFGDSFLADLDTDARDAVVAEVEAELEPTRFRDGRWVADYTRLRVVAERPG